MPERIIWTDCDHKSLTEEENVFAKAGIKDFRVTQCKNGDDVINNCQGAVVLLNQYTKLDRHVFENLPKLKCVVRYGVGVDNVNLADASACRIAVCNVPDYGTLEVADQAFALMISNIRKTVKADREVHAGIWDFNTLSPIHRMSTMTVGIYGLGRIGRAFAKRARAFGFKVLGYDVIKDPLKNDPECASFIKIVSEDELLKASDIISLHCSLTEDNRQFMNSERFSKMKQGVFFINVSRGGLVNESDLANALNSGQIAGAGIDVTCKEPLPYDSPLRKCDNLIITPHIAWYSLESASELKTKVAQEAVRAVMGEKLRCQVNSF